MNTERAPKYIVIGIVVAIVGMAIYDADTSSSGMPVQMEKKTRKGTAKKISRSNKPAQTEQKTRKPAAKKMTMDESIEKLKTYGILGTINTEKTSKEFLNHFMLYKDGEEGINDYPYVDKIIEMYYMTNNGREDSEVIRFPVRCIEAFLDSGCTIADAHTCCERVWRAATDEKLMSFMLRQLVKYTPQQVNEPYGKDGMTPLMYAVRHLPAGICKLLIEAGADVNARDKDDHTPLLNAAEASSVEICKMLIEAGVDVNARDEDGCTPLMLAVVRSSAEETCKTLLEVGADVNARDEDGWTPLMHAVVHSSAAKKCKILLEAGADVNARDEDGRTPLMRAVGQSSVETCKLLLEAGADVNARDEHGETPLIHAADNRYSSAAEKCKILLEAGADVNARSENGHTPLMYAVEQSSVETCELLLEAGADVNAKADDYTPIWAAMYKWSKALSEIYGSRDDVSEKIFLEKQDKLIEICKLLIAAGADLNARIGDMRTPLMYALRGAFFPEAEDMCHVLIAGGADVNARGEKGRTPLMYLNRRSVSEDMVETLIKAGADINARDDDGCTVYYHARGNAPSILEKYRAK